MARTRAGRGSFETCVAEVLARGVDRVPAHFLAQDAEVPRCGQRQDRHLVEDDPLHLAVEVLAPRPLRRSLRLNQEAVQ